MNVHFVNAVWGFARFLVFCGAARTLTAARLTIFSIPSALPCRLRFVGVTLPAAAVSSAAGRRALAWSAKSTDRGRRCQRRSNRYWRQRQLVRRAISRSDVCSQGGRAAFHLQAVAGRRAAQIAPPWRADGLNIPLEARAAVLVLPALSRILAFFHSQPHRREAPDHEAKELFAFDGAPGKGARRGFPEYVRSSTDAQHFLQGCWFVFEGGVEWRDAARFKRAGSKRCISPCAEASIFADGATNG